MLTAAQVATAAYLTEDGTLLCEECFDRGGEYARPVSRYELDEHQTFAGEDYEWPSLTHEGYPDDDAEYERVREYHEACVPALYDENGHELLEEYHWHREEA